MHLQRPQSPCEHCSSKSWLYTIDVDPENVTTQTIDIDSDNEDDEELDYKIKDPLEFIKKAQNKFLGSKVRSKPVDRNCLQETIANAFLDHASAERFLNIFTTQNVLRVQKSSAPIIISTIHYSRLLDPCLNININAYARAQNQEMDEEGSQNSSSSSSGSSGSSISSESSSDDD